MPVDFAAPAGNAWEDDAESDVDTIDGAQPSALAQESRQKRQLYTEHRQMSLPDGTPVVAGVSAQELLNRDAQRVAWEAAHPRRPRGQAPPQQPVPGDNPVDDVLGEYAGARAEEQALMSEAEHRFDKARYYKLLLGDAIFKDSSAAGAEVEAEIRAFAKERFEVFLGMRQERGAVPAVFEGWVPEDFQKLLELVRRLRQKPDLAGLPQGAAGPRPEPSINTSRTGDPAAAGRALDPEPSLRALPSPAGAGRPARPPQQVPAGPARSRYPQPRGRQLQPLVDPMTGTTKLAADGRVLQQDITPQVRPPPGSPYQPVPMPTDGPGIEALHASKAREAASTLERQLSASGATGIKLRAASLAAQASGTSGETVFEGQPYTPDRGMMVSTPGDERGDGVSRNA